MNRDQYESAILRAIIDRGQRPVRAAYSPAGECLDCAMPRQTCAGWHSSRYVATVALRGVGRPRG